MFRFLFFILMWILPCGIGWANISLTTFSMEFDADSAKRTDSLRFTNTSDKPKTYDISMVNFSQNSDGEYKTVSNPVPGNPFADTYLDWAPRRVTLAPRQSQVVRVARRSMAAADNGEYVSHLMIRELPDEADMEQDKSVSSDGINIDLRALYAVSIPVMIEKGAPHASAKISSVEIFKANTNPVAAVMVLRDGNRSFYGTLVVTDDGVELGRVSKFRIFMTTPARVVKIPLTRRPGSDTVVKLIDETTHETMDAWRI